MVNLTSFNALTIVFVTLLQTPFHEPAPTLREKVRVIADNRSDDPDGRKLNRVYRPSEIVPEYLRLLNEDPLFSSGTEARDRLIMALASTTESPGGVRLVDSLPQVQMLIAEYGNYASDEGVQGQISDGLKATIPEFRPLVRQFIHDTLALDHELARPDVLLQTAVCIGGLEPDSVPLLKGFLVDPSSFRPIMMAYANGPRFIGRPHADGTRSQVIPDPEFPRERWVRREAADCLLLSSSSLATDIAWLEAQPEDAARAGYEALNNQMNFRNDSYDNEPLFDHQAVSDQRAWLRALNRLSARFLTAAALNSTPERPVGYQMAVYWLNRAEKWPALKRECAELALRYLKLDNTPSSLMTPVRAKFIEWSYADLAQALDAP